MQEENVGYQIGLCVMEWASVRIEKMNANQTVLAHFSVTMTQPVYHEKAYAMELSIASEQTVVV